MTTSISNILQKKTLMDKRSKVIIEQIFIGHKKEGGLEEKREQYDKQSQNLYFSNMIYTGFSIVKRLSISNSSRENHILPLALWTDGRTNRL